MAEDIKFVVVGHVSRIVHAQRLAAMLDAHLLIDDGNHGANWNHRRALEWTAEQTCRVVVVEDDAMPVDLFFTSVTSWLNRFPESLVSFYLGTGRPPQYQMQVSEKAHRNLCADVVLFIDVLCDTDKQPVFSVDEEEQVREIYGPVHSRLLKQALDLINNADEAREKSQPPA